MKWLKPHETIHTTRGLYLRRWFLKKRKPGRMNVYLHNAVDSDDARALHDHPWANISIILRGGYIEHVFAYPPVNGQPLPPVIQKRRRAGQIIFRRADLAHRLELYPVPGDMDVRIPKWTPPTVKPCWSIFITGRKSREWGFWCQRPGTVGQMGVPVTDEQGARIVVLVYPGKVANWVHHEGFLEKVGCP